MEIVGHRGDPRHAPENTLASLEMAWRHGRRAMEVDVRAGRDGVPVMCHDATLERTTSARGPLAARSWPALRALGISSVADVLAAFRRRPATLFFDVKVTGAERRLHREIVRAGMTGRCRIAASQPASLAVYRSLTPSLPVYRVTGSAQPITPRLIAGAPRLALRGLLAFTRWVTAPLVRRCRAAGLELYVWTVRTAAEEQRLRRLGVTGIMTEYCPR